MRNWIWRVYHQYKCERMKIKLKIHKTVHENAALYYEKAKEVRKKIEGLEIAIKETRKEIEKAREKESEKQKQVKVKKEKKWYQKFNWFFTSGGKIAIGGKSAQQNDQLFAKHMDKADLFFHADIQGGSALILKEGKEAEKDELVESAQFAASFSNAWKNANASVDVYAVPFDQLSKHSQGGYIPTGGFAITGERTWFRSTKLGLKVGIGSEGVEIIPIDSKRALAKEIRLLASKSGKEKGDTAKIIAKRLGVHVDEITALLPNGRSKIDDKFGSIKNK